MCAIIHSRERSSHGNGKVGKNRLFSILSNIDSDQAKRGLRYFLSWSVEVLECRPLLPLPEEATIGTSDVVKNGRMTEQAKENTACRNIARLPARVAGSASCGLVTPGVGGCCMSCAA